MFYGVKAHLRRLAYGFIAGQCNKYEKCMYWLISLFVLVEYILYMVFLAVLTLDIETAYLLTNSVYCDNGIK